MSTVAVLGASPKNTRHSNQAVQMLLDHGHEVIPVNPLEKEICGQKVYPDLRTIRDLQIDTLTVYLSPERLAPLTYDIVKLEPARIIMNPGTEDAAIIQDFKRWGLVVVTACTLEMLRTGQF